MGRGKLVFKGEKKIKKKDGSAKIKYERGESVGRGMAGAGGSGSDSGSTQHLDLDVDATTTLALSRYGDVGASTGDGDQPDKIHNQGPQVQKGQGLITSSATVITGHGTAFKNELRVGDALLVRNQKGSDEMRIITMVLSNASASISSAFTSDLRNPTQFNYINKPRDDKREIAAKAEKARVEKEEVEQRAMGTYGNKGEIVYREKTEHGGYRIRKEKATTEMSRSDLLAARAGKKSDRYC
jgi:hypothetical protein